MEPVLYADLESRCRLKYKALGTMYHCCTPEDHSDIFLTSEDFRAGMNMIGICGKMFPKLLIITFELMSNHIHLLVAGDLEDILDMFEAFKKMLSKYLAAMNRASGLPCFQLASFRINDLENARNVIAYINRNGAKVHPETTPFSYVWGANMFFFNPEVKKRHEEKKRPAKLFEVREISHSRKLDSLPGVLLVDDYVTPVCFCDIESGELLFREAAHYFSKVSRHVEAYDDIAKMIGERIRYTDDELFLALYAQCRERYGDTKPQLLPVNAKLELARKMRYDYNANEKQIQRMLKLSPDIVRSLS